MYCSTDLICHSFPEKIQGTSRSETHHQLFFETRPFTTLEEQGAEETCAHNAPLLCVVELDQHPLSTVGSDDIGGRS